MTSYQKLKAKIEALEKENKELKRECVVLTFQDELEKVGSTFMELTTIKHKWTFALNSEKAMFTGNPEKRSGLFDGFISLALDDYKK